MTIGRQIAKLGITYRKHEKTTKYSKLQRQKAQERSRKLANLLYRSSCSVVIDDEKYFTFEGDNMPGNAGYDKNLCPDSVRFDG